MITVLHYISGLADIKAGVETFILNLNEKLSENDFRFCILTRNAKKNSSLYKQLSSNGIEIYEIPINELGGLSIAKYVFELNRFFEEHKEIDFLHMHGCDDPFVLKIARKNGISTSAVHVHSMTRENRNIIKRIVKLYTSNNNIKYADYLFACSDTAGQNEFQNKSYIVLKNTIDTRKFLFSSEKRTEYRNSFGIDDDTTAICYCGRFSKVKNIPFLLELFSDLLNKNRKVKLFLIGDGEERQNLVNIVNEKNISDSVIFTGELNDVEDVLSAMDVYVQTSIKEGFSISALESQCNGLPTFVSNGFPDEVFVTDLIKKLSLEEGCEVWASSINDEISKKRNYDRCSYSSVIRNAGYDSEDYTEYISEVYKNAQND